MSRRGTGSWLTAMIVLATVSAVGRWRAALETRRYVTLRSVPAQAGVFVDGRLVGETPLRLTLRGQEAPEVRLVMRGRGDLTFQLSAPGPEGRETTGDSPWKPRRKEEEILLELPPATESRLLITSDPTGAEIFLDGRRIGVTPLATSGILPGSRKIHATHPDCHAVQRTVQLKPAEEARVHLVLEDRVAVLYRSLIRKEPENLNHYTELAHHFVLLGKFNEAAEVFQAAYDVLREGDAEASNRLFIELRRVYTRWFIYPEETEGNQIRPVCRQLIERAVEEGRGQDGALRGALRSMDGYDRKVRAREAGRP